MKEWHSDTHESHYLAIERVISVMRERLREPLSLERYGRYRTSQPVPFQPRLSPPDRDSSRRVSHSTAPECRKTYETLLANGVKFTSTPTEKCYGVEAVCEELYGNPISLVEMVPGFPG